MWARAKELASNPAMRLLPMVNQEGPAVDVGDGDFQRDVVGAYSARNAPRLHDRCRQALVSLAKGLHLGEEFLFADMPAPLWPSPLALMGGALLAAVATQPRRRSESGR